MSVLFRLAESRDYDATERIEADADALLIDRFAAQDWPGATSAAEREAAPGFVLVAENQETAEAVGFVQVLEIDDHAHLEQLSVLPSFSRRGLGRRLVQAALDESRKRGYEEVTLRTYADVPWNAPFYASCGFSETDPDTHFLRSLIDVERALGLFDHGPRVQMTARLGDWQQSSLGRP